jgi:peroxiredoxin
MQQRKKFYRIALGLAVIATAGLYYWQSHTASAMVETGQTAPAFSTTATTGENISLGQFKGKTVVLEWNNAECPFVKKFYAIGKMQELQKTYTAKGVVWLTINSSAPGKQGNIDAAKANQLTAELNASPSYKILDPTGTIGRLYGAKTTPHMYVIDKQGVLVYQGAIDDNNSSDSADVKTAHNYVAAALDEVLGDKSVSVSSTRPYGCSVKY